MALHNTIGKWGEDIAYNYLIDNGYKIIACNWKYKHRDLNIVAFENNVLIIVEVKTRSNENFSNADQAVTYQKIRSLSIATNAFVKAHGINNDIRFDIVTIVGTYDKYTIRHTKDAFLPII